MRKSKKSDQQKERDRKGAERMKRFEDGQTEEEIVVPTPVDDNSDYEDCTVTAYQKKDEGDWEKVEIVYRRKKKGR